MTTFSYSITDLSHYESDLIEVTWESEDEAVDFGGTIARDAGADARTGPQRVERLRV
jgi:hypothetical protein